MTLVRETRWTCNDEQRQYGSNYWNVVFPMNGSSWNATLGVKLDVELALEFELD
jgi:hypothetical protein